MPKQAADKKVFNAMAKRVSKPAELTTDQAQQLDHQLNLQGRLLRDNWKDQAAKLASTSDKT